MNKIKILIVLSVGIAFTITPFVVHATPYQISPNPNYGTITVNTPDAYNSDNHFYNYGIIDTINGGTLNNNNEGVIINEEALNTVNGGTLNNYGTINSNGFLQNVSYATFNNYGTVNSSYALYNNTYATLNNYGTVDVLGGQVDNGNYGTLNNHGSLSNAGNTINRDTSMINNYNSLTNSGALTNLGTMTNSGTLNNSGTLTNSGIISGSSNYVQTAGQTILKKDSALSQTSINIQGGILTTSGNDPYAGNSTITGNVIIGNDATLHVQWPSTMTINGDFFSSGNLMFDMYVPGYGKPWLDVNGDAYFAGGTFTFNFGSWAQNAANYSWDADDFFFADSITGWDTLSYNIAGLNTDTSKGYGYYIFAVDPVTHVLTLTYVPEPTTILLLALGLIGLAGVRRKFKN